MFKCVLFRKKCLFICLLNYEVMCVCMHVCIYVENVYGCSTHSQWFWVAYKDKTPSTTSNTKANESPDKFPISLRSPALLAKPYLQCFVIDCQSGGQSYLRRNDIPWEGEPSGRRLLDFTRWISLEEGTHNIPCFLALKVWINMTEKKNSPSNNLITSHIRL